MDRTNTASYSLLFKIIIALSLFLLSCEGALAAQARLAWNQSTDPSVIGYKVYHGEASRNYTVIEDVQSNLTCLVSWTSETQPRYFAVTAYSATSESDFSEELTCHTIKAENSSNGGIIPSGEIVLVKGGAQTFSIAPAAGYAVSGLFVDGTSVGALSTYTFNDVSANHMISAAFLPITHTISASAASGGSISPTGSTVVNQGSSKTFTITPNTNYKISDVMVDGTSVGAVSTYTFSNITGAHSIAATFAPITHTISASAASGGSISPTGSTVVNQGSSKTFTITPNTNYKISDVMVDGTSVGTVSTYTFPNITSAHNIAATFAPITHTITSSAASGGSISPTGSTVVNQGSSKTFTITPNTNYKISDVKVDGASVGAVSAYTFSNVTGAHSIAATFAPITHTITASAASGGSISPTGSTVVNQGSSKTFTITPNTNYKISDVKVDGASVGAVSTYTFSNITGAHSIAATFAPITHTISASAASGGSISPTGSTVVNQGSSKTFTITPNANYKISDVTVDGATVGAVSSYVFSAISENHTIRAAFIPLVDAPKVDAGPDQVVRSGGMATLNGANSTASSGIVSYKWVQIGGPSVQLSNSASPMCTFTAPSVSKGVSLSFKLEAISSKGVSGSDTCFVNVSGTDLPPTVDAGSNQVVTPYTIVTLDGSGSIDTDDGIATYEWTQTSGPGVSINNGDTAVATFVAPDSGTQGATLEFKLVVTDHYGLKMTDHCTVNVINVNGPPTADAGPDKSVYDATLTLLDGSKSSDPSGSITYRWKQLTGTPVTFSDPSAQKPSFTAPDLLSGTQPLIFMLTVENEAGLSASSKCVITVQSVSGRDLTGNWHLLSYNDGIISGSLLIQNVGGRSISGRYQVKFYLSNDGTTVSESLGVMDFGSIAAGGSIKLLPNFWLPNGRGKYVIAVIDSTNKVTESREGNNRATCLIN